MRRVLAAFFVVTLLAGGLIGAFVWYSYHAPLPLPRTPFDFEVRAGSSLAGVANQLQDAGVLAHPNALIALARMTRADRAIKAGSYEVSPGITLRQLLHKLTQGDVSQASLTIVEGSNFVDLRRALRDNPQIVKTVIDLPDAQILARLGASERSLEGLFFPDTYFFVAGSTDEAVLKRAYRLQQTRLASAWARHEPGLPLADSYQVLILASIVEKETGRASDRPLIASVFINRLKRGMRLQTDPTVIYGIGSTFDGNLRRRDLDADSAYNTYTRDGLPPTPIALPSQASIDAVVNPPNTPYLYFVSRGDGSSEFSANLNDHNRAVAKYQRGAR